MGNNPRLPLLLGVFRPPLNTGFLALTSWFCTFFLDKIWKLLILRAFLPLTVAKLSTLKNILFWPTLYIQACVFYSFCCKLVE